MISNEKKIAKMVIFLSAKSAQLFIMKKIKKGKENIKERIKE